MFSINPSSRIFQYGGQRVHQSVPDIFLFEEGARVIRTYIRRMPVPVITSLQHGLRTPFRNFQDAVHLHSIDLLRGVASLSVALYHLVHERPEHFDAFPWLLRVTNYGHFGVEIFFVISGFVIPYALHHAGYTLRSFGTFMLKRLARLEPPYLVSILICIAIAVICQQAFPFSWQQLALHLAYLNTFFHYKWLNAVYWTLAIEFQYYILIGLLFPVLMRTYGAIIMGLVGCALAWLVRDHTLVFVHFPFFFLGMVLFQLKIRKLSSGRGATLMLLSAITIFFIHDFMYVLCGLSTLMVMVLPVRGHRAWMFFGGISYSLYLLHAPLSEVGMRFIAGFGTSDSVMALALLPCMVALIALSWMYRIAIEAPAHRWSKKIRYLIRSGKKFQTKCLLSQIVS
jgi:peptidoglycan/LPS O-acetylase OafA/YrhL